MKAHFPKFPNPVLGDENVLKLYVKLYGDTVGEKYLDVLNTSPGEITVVSRLIAYLKDRTDNSDQTDERS